MWCDTFYRAIHNDAHIRQTTQEKNVKCIETPKTFTRNTSESHIHCHVIINQVSNRNIHTHDAAIFGYSCTNDLSVSSLLCFCRCQDPSALKCLRSMLSTARSSTTTVAPVDSSVSRNSKLGAVKHSSLKLANATVHCLCIAPIQMASSRLP